MEIWPVSYHEFGAFFLIWLRMSVVLFMFPFFNARVIPIVSKVGLAFIMTLLLYPVLHQEMVEFPKTLWGMFQLILAELIVGMVLGLLLFLFFEGIKMMGQMVGFQTGFAITNIIDPQSRSQISIMANLAYFVAMTIFLLMNGHHILIHAMEESFEIIKVGSIGLNGKLLQKMIQASGDMFVLAVKLGAPAIAALLFTKVVFGLIAKLIPQMNIMIVAFPLQIVIGLLFFGVSLQVLLIFTERYLGDLRFLLINTMYWLKV